MIKRRFLPSGQISKIGFILFFSGLGLAAVRTVWSVYLKSFLGNDSYVGFLITAFTIIGIISYIVLIPLVEKKNNAGLFVLSTFLFFLSYLLFTIFTTLYAVIILGVLTSILASLRVTTIGIIISDKSKNSELSKNEGFVYTFFNLAWLVGPLFAGFISEKYGFSFVFLISSILMFLSLILFKFFKISDTKKPKRLDKNLYKLTKDFFNNKDRVFSYIISGGINFWWGLIYVFMPLYIIEMGFSTFIVGLFLFAIVAPLIFFSYYFGNLAGKKGFKKISFLGYLILSILAIFSFIFSFNPIIVMILLVLASVGGAMIESTSEAYFFDIIKKKQREKYYGVYNTAIDLNHLATSFIGAIILLFLPFKFLFLFFGVFMLFFSIVSLKLKNIVESRRKN
ncbi:MAG: MFS transporter [Nanoarchaeota archaeon]|nr:MFS transporter [Nanoarchaeota archaeon]MBU1027496.1 MFS transporter [Nanoarchaeota archaeon]